MSAEARLAQLGIALPNPPAPTEVPAQKVNAEPSMNQRLAEGLKRFNQNVKMIHSIFISDKIFYNINHV